MVVPGVHAPCPVRVPGDVWVQHTNGKKVPQKRYVRLGLGVQLSPVAPYVNCVTNFIHAVTCRAKLVKRDGIFQPRPPVAPGASYATVLKALRIARSGLPVRPTHDSLRPLTREQFVAGRPPGLKKVYQRAIDSQRAAVRGLRDLATLKGFVKVEKSAQPGPSVDGSTISSKPPRPIQPRDPAFNIELGRFTIPLEKTVFGDIATACNFQHAGETLPVVLKGYNSHQRAAIMRKHWERAGGDGRAVALPLDQSGFDAHINELALHFEHSVYSDYYPEQSELARLLTYTLGNKIRACFEDGVVKTRLGAMRMSGDMTTSLGNCLISSSLAYLLLRGFARASFVVDGDDTVLFFPMKTLRKISPRVVPHYLRYGFDAVAEEPCAHFEAIEFCQSHPVWDGNSWRLVRNVFKAIAQDYSGFEELLQDSYFKQFIHAVGSCGMSLCDGIPVLQEFYSFGLRNGTKGRGRMDYRGVGLWRQAKEMGGFRRWTPVTDAARLSFWRAFGVPPHIQELLEDHFKACTVTTEVVDCSKLPAHHSSTHRDIYTSIDPSSLVVTLRPPSLI